eukprot:12903537-Prorocentrum_lima.AAC.1
MYDEFARWLSVRHLQQARLLSQLEALWSQPNIYLVWCGMQSRSKFPVLNSVFHAGLVLRK